MAIAKQIKDAKGSWKGKSKLHLSWLPPEQRVSESDSTLHIDLDENRAFATVTYTWRHEDKRHEGTILGCGSEKSKNYEIAWVDSWHQSSAVMHLKGKEAEDGSLKVKGSYDGGGEMWGWTISLSEFGGAFTLKMENVTPAGEAEWAVEGIYHRE